jgi:hypothetical protein
MSSAFLASTWPFAVQSAQSNPHKSSSARIVTIMPQTPIIQHLQDWQVEAIALGC